MEKTKSLIQPVATYLQSLARTLRVFIHADNTGTTVSTDYLQLYLFTLLTIGLTIGFLVKIIGRKGLGTFLRVDIAVPARRIAKTAKEIERKTFHLSGLIVPLAYQFCLGRGWSQEECITIAWSVTIGIWLLDFGRLYIPFIRNNWPLDYILRAHERNQLSGTCFFSLGTTLAMNLYSPSVACASICYLVVGDLCAALFGVAFGGETCIVKLGRGGKKSMEGSIAMFISCCIIGMFLFAEEPLREYPVVLGAAVATVVELFEPFAVNDNLSIPVFTGLALHLGFGRMEAYCQIKNAGS